MKGLGSIFQKISTQKPSGKVLWFKGFHSAQFIKTYNKVNPYAMVLESTATIVFQSLFINTPRDINQTLFPKFASKLKNSCS